MRYLCLRCHQPEEIEGKSLRALVCRDLDCRGELVPQPRRCVDCSAWHVRDDSLCHVCRRLSQ